MTLGFGVAIGLLAAVVAGASWRGFAEIQWRLTPLCYLGLAIQLVLFSNSPLLVTPLVPIASELHILSYGSVIAFLLANWRIPGISVILCGCLLNFTAIVANDGHMPRSVAPSSAVVSNVVAMDSNTRLPILGDYIQVPLVKRLFSIGDVLITLGGGVTAYRIARAKPRMFGSLTLGRFE